MHIQAIKPSSTPKKQDDTLDKSRRGNKSTSGNKPSLNRVKRNKIVLENYGYA